MKETTGSPGTPDHTALILALRSLMPEWEVNTIDRFDYLSGGYSNENYRFAYGPEVYVIRVPTRARPFVNRATEEAFYQQKKNLSVPELIALDIRSGVMLTRFEDGELLSEARPQTPALASYLKGFHRALPESARRYDPLSLSREYLSAGRAPRWIKDLSEEIWIPENSTPCHNDLNPWNIIIASPARWVTLDWESFGSNDPLFDLIALHQGLEMDDESLIVLVELWGDAPADQPRIERCLRAFWLREYAWAHAELHHGNRRPEIERQLAHSRDRLTDLSS